MQDFTLIGIDLGSWRSVSIRSISYRPWPRWPQNWRPQLRLTLHIRRRAARGTGAHDAEQVRLPAGRRNADPGHRPAGGDQLNRAAPADGSQPGSGTRWATSAVSTSTRPAVAGQAGRSNKGKHTRFNYLIVQRSHHTCSPQRKRRLGIARPPADKSLTALPL